MGGEWELNYFSLLCIEKVHKQYPPAIAKNHELWEIIVKSLVHPHPWSKQVSSRIMNSFFLGMDPSELASMNGNFLVERPGSLYDIARNLCQQLDTDEECQVDELSLLAIKNLVWIVRAMTICPHLCFDSNAIDANNLPESTDDPPLQKHSKKDPVLWLMTRLSNIAKQSGSRRREAVFKCFAAFASSCAEVSLNPYLELMIEPINRAITEASSKEDRRRMHRRQEEHDEAIIPKEALQLLEERCGTESFLNVLASVQSKARTKREKRKQIIAAEAVQNPEAAAKRKLLKQEREKQRRKRRIQDKKMVRSAHGKKARVS
uniref:U3 small nucleolar RNA-associated protein 20 C-terminal domain-containing protein n=1 Tax=Pseudictyota dubia TaxID=2749911 RepID=A0A7R9VK46_9STRA